MALRYADSFDHQDLTRYQSVNDTQTWPAGRRGTSAFRITDTGPTTVDWHFQQAVSVTDNVLVCGLAIKLTGSSGSLVNFRGGSTSRAQLTLDSLNGLTLSNFGSSINMGAAVSAGVWHYVEFKIVYDATAAGYAEIRLNGETVATHSGATDTDHLTIDNVFVGGNGSPDALIEDFVVLDGTGTNNDFLGDIRVEYVLPVVDGATTQLTGSDGDQVDNYDNINETILTTIPGDYNASTGVGDMDLYGLSTLDSSVSRTVYGVHITGKIGKLTGTNAYGRLVAVEGSTTYGSIVGLTTDFLSEFLMLNTSPDGSTWSASNYANLEIGYQVTGATGV